MLTRQALITTQFLGWGKQLKLERKGWGTSASSTALMERHDLATPLSRCHLNLCLSQHNHGDLY